MAEAEKQQYSYNAYDKYLCLKMGAGLWLVIGYLMRAYVITIISVVKKHGDRMELINMFYPDRSGLALSAVAALFAIVVVYAWGRRAPEAPAHVKWLWQRGRMFLLLSTLVNIVIIFVPFLYQPGYSLAYSTMLQLVVSLLLFAYLATSRRVTDTFRDYPEAVAVKG